MWETIRGYLTFNRKERAGVLFLLLLITVLFIVPYFFKSTVGESDPEAYQKMKEGIRRFEHTGTDSPGRSFALPYEPRNMQSENNLSEFEKPISPKLFYFDPNLIGTDQWQRLGLSEKLSKTILHYVEKGGKFRRPEDLGKIYGMPAAVMQKLIPYVRLPKSGDSIFRRKDVSVQNRRSFEFVEKKPADIEINLSDSLGWAGLPGIGPKLAGRIIRFREKLGGFYSVEQVSETFGLPDSVFKKIQPFLKKQTTRLNTIHLNSATKEQLQSHPYIRWQIAKEITAYRQQHGNFQSIDELLQIAQMDSARFVKLQPYLVVDP